MAFLQHDVAKFFGNLTDDSSCRPPETWSRYQLSAESWASNSGEIHGRKPPVNRFTSSHPPRCCCHHRRPVPEPLIHRNHRLTTLRQALPAGILDANRRPLLILESLHTMVPAPTSKPILHGRQASDEQQNSAFPKRAEARIEPSLNVRLENCINQVSIWE